eukprot:GHVN01027404.1.p1 GENE.GHVN01027404.1~~GHVN01027404.1.p1  ORF type:complete len:1324 (-),score=167.95 GHVN01027404.1:2043-6014(-)
MTKSRIDRLYDILSTETASSEIKGLAVCEIEEINTARGHGTPFLIDRTVPLLLSAVQTTRSASASLLGTLVQSLGCSVLPQSIEIAHIDFDLTTAFGKQNIFNSRQRETETTAKLSIRERLVKRRKQQKTTSKTAQAQTCMEEWNAVRKKHPPLLASLIFFSGYLHAEEWTARHGACLGVSAILAAGVERIFDASTEDMAPMKDALTTVLKRQIELLIHERFSDYNGDHVSTPVKDACCEGLYLLISHRMFTGLFSYFVDVFLSLGASEDWHVRHSSLSLLGRLLRENRDAKEIKDFVIGRLGDSDSDIQELAAKTLVDVDDDSCLTDRQHALVVEHAIQALGTAAEIETISWMIRALAGRLCRQRTLHPGHGLILKHSRHPQKIVRKAVIECIACVVLADELVEEVVLRLLANIALEMEDEIRTRSFELLQNITDKALLIKHAEAMLQILKTPLMHPFKVELFGIPLREEQEHFFDRANLLLLSEEQLTQNRILLSKALLPVSIDKSMLLEGTEQIQKAFYLVAANKSDVSSLVCNDTFPLPSGRWSDAIRLFMTKHRIALAHQIDKPEILISLQAFQSKVGWIRRCAVDNTLEWILKNNASLEDSLLFSLDVLTKPFLEHLAEKTCPVLSVALDNIDLRCLLEEYLLLDARGLIELEGRLEGRLHQTENLLSFKDTTNRDLLISYFLPSKEARAHIFFATASTGTALGRYLAQLNIAKLRSDALLPIVTTIVRRMKTEKATSGDLETILLLTKTRRMDMARLGSILVLPMLKHLSKDCHTQRSLASLCFSELVPLLVFEKDMAEDSGLRDMQLEAQSFLAQLTGTRTIEQMPSLNTTPRQYQAEGIAWLCFLGSFGLGAAICDDMGLGKTLQTLAAIQWSHEEDKRRNRKTGPALIVCPGMLVSHWTAEIKQHLPQTRICLLKEQSVVEETFSFSIASYETVARAALAENTAWEYCVLDEAHFIKSPQAKKTLAVKKIRAKKRIILTGTPIQNDVLELWSLFDFLMPGFLGSQAEFVGRYSAPIAGHQNKKYLREEERRAINAMSQLHKKISPFILRRMKADVLDDLPEKTIQDYYCEMPNIQRAVYEENEAHKTEEKGTFAKTRHLQTLCSHPCLSKSSSDRALLARLAAKHKSCPKSYAHSGKLCGLKDLLMMCGLGQKLSTNRFVVFSQTAEMLDLVETQLLGPVFEDATYTRLDLIPPEKRVDEAMRFNRDPSLDILLCTTSAGSHGLCLVGANTVIFVEHSWNPQTDLQAMDRAHRIGQRRAVTVYRLILKDTIEERIMDLQHFKLRLASTVVRQQSEGEGLLESLVEMPENTSFK